MLPSLDSIVAWAPLESCAADDDEAGAAGFGVELMNVRLLGKTVCEADIRCAFCKKK